MTRYFEMSWVQSNYNIYKENIVTVLPCQVVNGGDFVRKLAATQSFLKQGL